MSGPFVAVRLTLTVDDLDEYGQGVSDLALRRIRGDLDDMPARARLIIDLGPMRQVDYLLMAALSVAPCAPNIQIEASCWRTALASYNHLLAHLGAIAGEELGRSA